MKLRHLRHVIKKISPKYIFYMTSFNIPAEFLLMLAGKEKMVNVIAEFDDFRLFSIKEKRPHGKGKITVSRFRAEYDKCDYNPPCLIWFGWSFA